jgi:hypothetical protein
VNENKNPQAAEVIRTVMLEEMLHLTLVAKLMNARRRRGWITFTMKEWLRL